MNRYTSLALLVGAAAMVACGDSARQGIAAPARSTAVKFFNFAAGSPGVPTPKLKNFTAVEPAGAVMPCRALSPQATRAAAPTSSARDAYLFIVGPGYG